jgi:hypothetical protein
LLPVTQLVRREVARAGEGEVDPGAAVAVGCVGGADDLEDVAAGLGGGQSGPLVTETA